MLLDSNLPKELWPESIDVTIVVINKSPTIANPGKASAYDRFSTGLTSFASNVSKSLVQ